MCLSVPGKVIETDGARSKVDVAGNVVDADLTLTPDVQPGDYVLVHAGFAIQKYDEAEALETLRMLEEVFGEGADAEV
ncbi:MAG: HypC/HybG/HupF family hydrogenase formation chaperone [Planctomycetota bacterium]